MALRDALVLLVTLACAVGCHSPTPVAPIGQQLPSPIDTQTLQGNGSSLGVAAVYELSLAADRAAVTVEPLAVRTLADNDDLYQLPVGCFFGPGDFEIRSIKRNEGTLEIAYAVHHPMAAPSDPTALASATNRADLGIAGMVVLLADVETATGNTYFTDVIANTATVANADAYFRPRALLPNLGTVANTFPYKLLVDESGLGNREGISNAHNPEGNFGQWTGFSLLFGWTGYGVLHQGQTALNTLVLNDEVLVDGPLSFRVAIVAKYNDPRGGTTPEERRANRLPADPQDLSKFGYRMPHGSLDCEAVEFLGESGTLVAGMSGTTELAFRVTDFDARAEESTAATLALEPDATKVTEGAAGAPSVAISIPGVIGDATVVDMWNTAQTLLDDDSQYDGDAGIDSGTPDDGLTYRKQIAVETPVAQAGERTGMVRVTDPEDAVANGYMVALEENLTVVDGLAPQPDTYQAFPVRLAGGWAVALEENDTASAAPVGFTANGNAVVLGSVKDDIDIDPGPAIQMRNTEWQGNFLLILDKSGNYLDDRIWHGYGPYAPFVPGASTLDADGALVATGYFSEIIDLDPNSEVVTRTASKDDSFVAAFDGAVHPRWIATFPGDPASKLWINQVIARPNGGAFICGILQGTVDIDPGPGIAQHTSTGVRDGYVMALTNAGTLDWFYKVAGPYSDRIDSIAVGFDGSLWAAGGYQGSVDFDPGGAVDEHFSGAGSPCVIRLTINGNYVGVTAWGFSDTGVASIGGVYPDGSLALAVRYTSRFDADPGPSTTLLPPAIQQDSAIIRLGPSQEFQWAAALGNTVNIDHLHVGVALDGGVFAFGHAAAATIDLDPGPSQVLRTLNARSDYFVVKLDWQGRYVWDATIGGTDDESLNGVVQSATGRLLCAGSMQSDGVDFDPHPHLTRELSTTTNQSPFITVLESDGKF